MSLFDTLGLLVVLFCSLIGFASFVYCAYRGAMLIKKQIELGTSCMEVADEVVKDIQTPVLRPQAVR